jgi:hypothetical protein
MGAAKGRNPREVGQGMGEDYLDVITAGHSKTERDAKKRAKERKHQLSKQQDKVQDYFEKKYPKFKSLTKELKKRGVSEPEARQLAVEQINPQLAASFERQEADIGRLRGVSEAKGPSAFAQQQLEQQRLEQLSGSENLYKQQAQAGQQAFSDLASQGGAESGARERLAAQAGSSGLREQQALARQGQLSRLGIGSEDEARKLQIMQNLPGLQQSLTQSRQNALESDRNAQFAAEQFSEANRLSNQQNLYGMQAQDVAAQRQARADKYKAGGEVLGGSMVGSAQLKALQKGQPGPFGFGKSPFGFF